MCLAQKLDAKMVFWTLIVSLVILIGVSCYFITESFRLKSKYDSYSAFMTNHMTSNSKLIIATFIIIVLLAITAIASVISDWYPLLIIHAYIFVILSIFMIIIGFYTSGESRDIDGHGSILMRTVVDLENVLDKPEWFSFNLSILEPLQREMRCCGVYNWKDYWRPMKRAWIAQKLDIKMVFWTLIVSFVVLIGVSCYCIWESIRLKSKYDNYATFMANHMSSNSKLMIAMFIIVLIFAITALVSVVFDWYPLLIIHAYLFVILSLLMLAVGFYASGESRDIDGGGSILLRTLLDLESVLDRPEWFSFNHTILDPLQREMRCCGVYDWKDYWRPLKRATWIGDMLPLPKSCCDDQTVVCMPIVKTARQDGCMSRVGLYTTSSFTKYGSILVVFGLSVGINAAFLFILARKAKEYYFFYPYYM